MSQLLFSIRNKLLVRERERAKCTPNDIALVLGFTLYMLSSSPLASPCRASFVGRHSRSLASLPKGFSVFAESRVYWQEVRS